MGVRLKDVASRAGVSVKTVSNVVHGYIHVRSETRARVQRVLDELNYRPNVSARNLRTGRSGIIALALPELDVPYFAELARLVIRAAEERSWTVLIDQTDGLIERERLVARGIRDQVIDGLIFSPLALGPDELAGRVDRTPLVLLGERSSGGAADHVAIDNVAAAHLATTHLIELGRRRIAAIGAQHDVSASTARLRLDGYSQALRDGGLDLNERLVMSVVALHRADGAAAMARLIGQPDPPDAVFCFNDLLALGAIRACAERGFRVPEDVAIVGFDDIEDGRYSTPNLTTISPDKEQIARIAVTLLFDRLGGEPGGPPREVRADYTLVRRESTLGRAR